VALAIPANVDFAVALHACLLVGAARSGCIRAARGSQASIGHTVVSGAAQPQSLEVSRARHLACGR
jgi:hypothetical protein